MKGKRRLKDWVAVAAACFTALAAICCGRTVCLCSDDPDGCGEPCHTCCEDTPDGLSATDSCTHFAFDALDFWMDTADMRTVGGEAPPMARAWTRFLPGCTAFKSLVHVSRANAPPIGRTDSAPFRVRKILLLS